MNTIKLIMAGTMFVCSNTNWSTLCLEVIQSFLGCANSDGAISLA